MKVDPIEKDKVVIEDQQQVKKQVKFLGSERLKPGHTLYEVNTRTMEVKPAEYEKLDAVLTDLKAGTRISRRIMVKEDCVYISALNEKNIYRKLSNKLLNHYGTRNQNTGNPGERNI